MRSVPSRTPLRVGEILQKEGGRGTSSSSIQIQAMDAKYSPTEHE